MQLTNLFDLKDEKWAFYGNWTLTKMILSIATNHKPTQTSNLSRTTNKISNKQKGTSKGQNIVKGAIKGIGC
jgi:hypothetical protein